MKIYNIRSLFFLIISPLLSLISLKNGIYESNRRTYFLLAIIFSIVSYNYIPTADSYRHYNIIKLLSSLNLKESINILLDQKDFIYYFILLLIYKIFNDYFFAQAIVVFVYYYYLLNLFKEITDSVELNNRKIFFLLYFLSSYSFTILLYTGRFPLAILFFLLSLYYNSINSKKKYIYIFLAICTHYSLILYWICIWIFIKLKKWLPKFYILSFICIVFSKFINSLVYKSGEFLIGYTKIGYTIMDYSKSLNIFLGATSINNLIYRLITNVIPFFIIQIIYIFLIKKGKTPYLERIMYILFSICNIFLFQNSSIFSRTNTLVLALFPVIILYNFKEIKKIVLVGLIALNILIQSFNIYFSNLSYGLNFIGGILNPPIVTFILFKNVEKKIDYINEKGMSEESIQEIKNKIEEFKINKKLDL